MESGGWPVFHAVDGAVTGKHFSAGPFPTIRISQHQLNIYRVLPVIGSKIFLQTN